MRGFGVVYWAGWEEWRGGGAVGHLGASGEFGSLGRGLGRGDGPEELLRVDF